MQSWDLFCRAERSPAALNGQTFDAYWEAKGAWHVRVSVPVGCTLEEGLAHIRNTRQAPRGSQRGGVFEIQTDGGVWSHAKNRRIDRSNQPHVTFVAWTD